MNRSAYPLLRTMQKILVGYEAGRDFRDLSREFLEYISASIRLKHQSFKEEREIRLSLSTYSAEAMESVYARSPSIAFRPGKIVRQRQKAGVNVRYIALFEQLRADLPIKRVIVRPSRNQDANLEKASDIIKGKMPVVRSATPYLG